MSLRFADLQNLTLVIPQQAAAQGRRISTHGFRFGHAKSDKSATINLSKISWIELGRPVYIQIFIAPSGVIAIKPCLPTDDGARRLDSTRRVRTLELGMAFDLKPGERFTIEGVVDEGHCLGQLSDELMARMAERRRRERGQQS